MTARTGPGRDLSVSGDQFAISGLSWIGTSSPLSPERKWIVGKHYPYLHQRGDHHYFFWNRNGKRLEESLRTTDLEIANQRYHQRMTEIRNGCSPNDRSMWTLQHAADDWLEQRQYELARGSYVAERSIVRNLVRELKADSRLRSLADISKLRGYRLERRRAGAAAKTVNNEMQVLRGMLEQAQL